MWRIFIILIGLLVSSCDKDTADKPQKDDEPEEVETPPSIEEPKKSEEEPKKAEETRKKKPEEIKPKTPQKNTPPKPTEPTTATKPQPPTIDIKDKTAFPKLQPTVEKAEITGWKKNQSTDIDKLPPKMPDSNTAYYRAEKNINGKMRTVSVVFGNILREQDAIVNAANGGLEGGSGIDDAIHTKALVGSKDLMKEEAKAYKKLQKITTLPVGSAMVMHPYSLEKDGITMVVFTVGPRVANKKDIPTEEQKRELYSAVYNSLVKASEFGAKTISIPAISSGIFNFDLKIASELYFAAVFQYFAKNPNTSIEHVRFISFDNNEKSDNPTLTRVAQAFLALFP